MVKLATTVTHSTYPTMDGQAELAWMAGEIASITQKWDILSGAGSKLSNLFIEIKIRVIKKLCKYVSDDVWTPYKLVC